MEVFLGHTPDDIPYYVLMDYTGNKPRPKKSRMFANGIVGESLARLNEQVNTLFSNYGYDIHWRKDVGILI